MDFQTLSDFLSWLSFAGLPWFVGIVVSLLASRVELWNKLPSDVKAFVIPCIAVIFAFVFRSLNVPFIVDNPDVNFAYQVILFYLSSQKQHDRNIIRAIKFLTLRSAQ